MLLRLVGKWLNAGVMEEGRVYRPDAGTPQGGVISPLLANVYLHEVLDERFAREVGPRLRGRAHLVRHADDFVIAFELEEDARRVMDVLPKRFGKYVRRADLRHLRDLHVEYLRAMQALIAKSEPNECVGLLCLQLLDLSERDDNALA